MTKCNEEHKYNSRLNEDINEKVLEIISYNKSDVFISASLIKFLLCCVF